MAEQSLKNKALLGVIWNAVETFILQGGQFVIGIVLARLLSPNDYGLIGMLAIFIAVSQTFIDSGMGHALIQKKDRTKLDYSTVFIFNLLISILLYVILFFSAPLISKFYETPQLVLLTRVLTINIILNSFALVQNTRLVIDLDFRTKAKVSTVSVVLGGSLAIFLAYKGMGVWALVVQTLSRTLITVIMLWLMSKWKPSIKFSKESFRGLFKFGSRILGVNILSTVFNNIYNIVIGKAFSAKELGYYTQAMNIADVTSGSISSILQKVTFPILASLQDDKERMVSVYKRLIGMTAFFVFPAMTLLSVLSEPFILFFLTDKWMSTIVLLQWLCFARIIRPVSALNMNILNAIGRSDLFLKVDLSKIPIAVIALVITVPLGVKAIVIGHVISSFLAFFINAYMPGKLFGYGAWSQIKDMSKVILAVGIMVLVVHFSLTFFESNGLKFFLGGVIGIGSYVVTTLLLNMEEPKEVIRMAKSLITKEHS